MWNDNDVFLHANWREGFQLDQALQYLYKQITPSQDHKGNEVEQPKSAKDSKNPHVE